MVPSSSNHAAKWPTLVRSTGDTTRYSAKPPAAGMSTTDRAGDGEIIDEEQDSLERNVLFYAGVDSTSDAICMVAGGHIQTRCLADHMYSERF